MRDGCPSSRRAENGGRRGRAPSTGMLRSSVSPATVRPSGRPGEAGRARAPRRGDGGQRPEPATGRWRSGTAVVRGGRRSWPRGCQESSGGTWPGRGNDCRRPGILKAAVTRPRQAAPRRSRCRPGAATMATTAAVTAATTKATTESLLDERWPRCGADVRRAFLSRILAC